MSLNNAKPGQIEAWQNGLRRFIASKMPDSDFIEDLVQLVFIAMLIKQRPDVRDFGAYLYGAARYGVWHHVKGLSRLRYVEVLCEDVEPLASHSHRHHADLGDAIIRRIIQRFNELYDASRLAMAARVMTRWEQELFVAHYVEGRSYDEIAADEIGKSAGALRQVVCRAKKDLPRRWAKRAETLEGIRIDPTGIDATPSKRRGGNRVFRLC